MLLTWGTKSATSTSCAPETAVCCWQSADNLYKQPKSEINVIHDLSLLSCELCAQTFDNLADYNSHKLKEHQPKRSYGNPHFTTVTLMANIVNITATFTLKGPVKIPEKAEYKHYMTKKSGNIVRFPGAIYKNFGHTFILYKSGKVICVGGRKLDILESICKKVAKIVIGHSRIYDFEIKNFVGCLSLPNFLDLNSTAELIKRQNVRIAYDPELFAALLIYTENCLVLLFHTGKVIFTGVREIQNIEKSWEFVSNHLIWK